MAEINVVKKTREDAAARWPGFEVPFFRGSVYGVNPFALMRQLTNDMDLPPILGNGAEWSPALEVKEKGGKLAVTAELPGLTKEDIKVHIDGDTLVVEGERKQEKEEKREGYFHSERSYGKFYRSILLPEGAKADETAAQFNNGVLEVTIPLAEVKPSTKQIPVEEGTKKAAA